MRRRCIPGPLFRPWKRGYTFCIATVMVISLASMPDLHTMLCFGNCQTAPWTHACVNYSLFQVLYRHGISACIIASYDSEAYKWLHTSHSLAANNYNISDPEAAPPPPPPPSL